MDQTHTTVIKQRHSHSAGHIAQVITDNRKFLEERNQLELKLEGAGGFLVVGAGLPELALIPFTKDGQFLEHSHFMAHLDKLDPSDDLTAITQAIHAASSPLLERV